MVKEPKAEHGIKTPGFEFVQFNHHVTVHKFDFAYGHLIFDNVGACRVRQMLTGLDAKHIFRTRLVCGKAPATIMGSDVQNSPSRNNADVGLDQGAIPLVEPIWQRGGWARRWEKRRV